jgi:predicted DNA-binding transcriptional regulator YafY
MTNRMSNLDRTLHLVRALTESIEGLTLDEMASEVGVKRRTVERMRDVIQMHFDLDDITYGRSKRFRIKDTQAALHEAQCAGSRRIAGGGGRRST